MSQIQQNVDVVQEDSPLRNDKICGCACSSDWFQRYFSIINILIFETTGMAFISYLILTFGGTVGFPGALITIFGMFVCFLWTGRFTGTFLNPAIVICCMIKKERSVPLIKGMVYIISQIIGAMIGTFIAWATANDGSNDLIAPFTSDTIIDAQVGVFARQIIGTFIFCTIVLILVSSDTTFVEMDIQIWLTIPLILVGTCILMNLPLGFNPAWSLTYQLAWGIYNQNNFIPMTYCWTFIVGPLLGGFLAGLFFEFIFRKFILSYKVQLKHEEQLFIQRLNQEERKRRKNRNSQIQLV